MSDPAVASAAARPARLDTSRRALSSGVVALAIAVAGWLIVAAILAGQAAQPDGQFGIDFADYHTAAVRMAAGDSPYAPDMLTGPIPSQGQDRYRYPPVLAAFLIPLSGLPVGTAAAVWLVVGIVTIIAASTLPLVWPRRAVDASRIAWAIALTAWFFPVFDGLLKGNVGGLVALAAAVLLVGSATAGAIATGAGGVLKLTPILGAIPLARRSPRSLVVLAATVLVLFVPTLILWPQSWLDYAIVLPNLIAGSATGAGGLAPAALLEAGGSAAASLAPLIRLVTLAGVVLVLIGSWMLASRPATWPAAVLLSVVAGLLLPAAIWYHYLVVLLPFVVAGWPTAGARARTAILSGLVLIDVAIIWIPLATLGATLIVVALLAPVAVRSRLLEARPALGGQP